MMKRYVISLVFNRKFMLGFLCSIIIFSKYIFGPDDLTKNLKVMIDQMPKTKTDGSSVYTTRYHGW